MELRVGENEPICTTVIHQSFSIVANTPNNLSLQTVPQLQLLRHHLLLDNMQQSTNWTICQHISSARELFPLCCHCGISSTNSLVDVYFPSSEGLDFSFCLGIRVANCVQFIRDHLPLSLFLGLSWIKSANLIRRMPEQAWTHTPKATVHSIIHQVPMLKLWACLERKEKERLIQRGILPSRPVIPQRPFQKSSFIIPKAPALLWIGNKGWR